MRLRRSVALLIVTGAVIGTFSLATSAQAAAPTTATTTTSAKTKPTPTPVPTTTKPVWRP